MGNKLQRPRTVEEVAEQELQLREDSNFTCEICIEPMLSIRKFKNGNLCTHPFCLDCIAKYIEVKIDNAMGNIDCPGLSCEHSLDPLSCRPIISKSLFERWCDFLRDLAVLSHESCYCPHSECSVLVVNECKDKLQKVKCPNCKHDFCFQCKIPWHAGYKCSESGQLRERNDILVGHLIEEKKWTRCYKCGHAVELVRGCRFIHCKCGSYFCHDCGRRSGECGCKAESTGHEIRYFIVYMICGLIFCVLIYIPLCWKAREGYCCWGFDCKK